MEKTRWDRLVALLGLFWQILLGIPEKMSLSARGHLFTRLMPEERTRLRDHLHSIGKLAKSDDMFVLLEYWGDAATLVDNEEEAAALIEVVFDLTAKERKELVKLALAALKIRRMTIPIQTGIPAAADESWNSPPGAGEANASAVSPDAVDTYPPAAPTAAPRSAITPAPYVPDKAEPMPGLPPAPTDLPGLVIASEAPVGREDETSAQRKLVKFCKTCGEPNVMNTEDCARCRLLNLGDKKSLDETEDLVLPANEAVSAEAPVSDTSKIEEAPAPDTTNVEPAIATPSLAPPVADEDIVGSASLPPAAEPEPARPSKTTSLDMGAVDITPLKQVLMSLFIYYERIGKDNLKTTLRLPHPTVVTIGRNALTKPLKVVSCDWDPRVSSMQAELELRPDGHAFLRDMNSTNGTFLNGVLVKEPVEVRPGNRIKVGDTIIAVGLEEYFGDWTELPSLRADPDHADFLDEPEPEGAQPEDKPEPITAEPPTTPPLDAPAPDGQEDKKAEPEDKKPADKQTVQPSGETVNISPEEAKKLASDTSRPAVTPDDDIGKGDTKMQTGFTPPIGVPPLPRWPSERWLAVKLGIVLAAAFVFVGVMVITSFSVFKQTVKATPDNTVARVAHIKETVAPPAVVPSGMDPEIEDIANLLRLVDDSPLSAFLTGQAVPKKADDCFPLPAKLDETYYLSGASVGKCCNLLGGVPRLIRQKNCCDERALPPVVVITRLTK